MGLTIVRSGMIEDGSIITANIINSTIVSADIDDATIETGDIASTTIANTKMALDPSNATNLNAGDVPAAQLGNIDLTGIEDDIALLGFKIAANGSLAKYNLVDQTVDAFEDASGIDAGASSNATRNAANYYSGPQANMILVSNLTVAQAAPTKGDIVFTYTNGAGTAVINTNITAEISADNGSTWTAFTLTSQGTTGGHTILTSHDQTITSTITAPYNMKYRIKTLVQSISMQTRIHAVSLGWS